MPRAARGLVGGQIYHVLNRGNGLANVFHKPQDFEAFVYLIAAAKQDSQKGQISTINKRVV